ncbi:MAG: UDP-glucose 4-epimerase [Chloroflexota bacterium]|nr:UDP-glucose 4-epimerase [Chloroflexota bacterium]
MSTPKRILVTGGAGFIGLHTVRQLAGEGFTVLVVDDLRHACGEPLPPSVELDTADLNSPAAAQAIARFRPDAILHLAAQGGVSRSIRDPAGDALVNVLGTVGLLKASADAGCRRFVFASSGGAIYGRATRLPTPERASPKPLSPYGAAKLAAEGYLGTFARTFGLRTLALRYSNVYGPFQDGTGEAGVVAITCERLLSGRAPEIRGDGQQTRDFVFVADVADANLRALRSRVTGVMNIGTGVPSSVRTVVDELVAVAAYPGPIDLVEGRPGEVRDTALDARRAQKLLEWRAPTPLRDGLRQTFTSFRERARPTTARATVAPAGAEARPGRGSPAGSG